RRRRNSLNREPARPRQQSAVLPGRGPGFAGNVGQHCGRSTYASGFDLDRPEAGDPVEENATGLLLRYCKWMVEVVGVDGLRRGAAKHVPAFFWNDFFDRAVFHIGSGGTTPYSFGEVIAGGSADDLSKLRSYTRKDGFGNRDVLDFPLFFTMRNVLNGTGNGSMRALERASADIVDGDPNDGSIGVQFVQNHDGIGEPPAANNIALRYNTIWHRGPRCHAHRERTRCRQRDRWSYHGTGPRPGQIDVDKERLHRPDHVESLCAARSRSAHPYRLQT